jgi:hypothetical protein
MSTIEYHRYEKDILVAPKLLEVLMTVDTEFEPALTDWLDLESYAQKMAQHAVCWLAFDREEVVGFAACYVNKAPLYSFWTMLAIRKEYRNRMIALYLEPMIIAFCHTFGSSGIKAEVDPRHSDLIKLHHHFGFRSNAEQSERHGRKWIELQLTF